MATVIRDISGNELRLFGDIVARLERLGPDIDARSIIFLDVMRLLRGDFGASYVWDRAKTGSTRRLASTWIRAIFAATRIGISSAIQ